MEHVSRRYGAATKATSEDGRMHTLTTSAGKLGPHVSLALLLVLSGCSSGGGGGDAVTVNGDVSIAYVKRPVQAAGNPTDSVQNGIQGGDLYLRQKSSPSSPEIPITQSYTLGHGDVSDPEVSYDGSKLLFSMRCTAQSAPQCYNYSNLGNDFSWNVWEFDLVTQTMRRVVSDPAVSSLGDDVDPVYLPDGRIVFASTRQTTSRAAAGSSAGAVGYQYTDEYEREPVTALHVMDNNGANVRQISFNQSHDRNPTVLSTGEIMYARWDHVGGRNQFSIFKINPDGTDFFVMYGAHSPGNSYLHPRELPDGRVISTLMPLSRTSEGGSLEIIDIKNYSEYDLPADVVGVPNDLGERVGQYQVSRLLATGQSLATHEAMRGNGISPLGRYTTPYPLWDGTNRVLVTYTPSQPTTVRNTFLGTNQQVEGTPKYGIWMLDLNRRTLNVVVPPQDGFLYSDPVAIQARPVPGIKGVTPLDTATTGAGMGILNVKSVYDTDSRGNMGAAVLAAGESIPTSGGVADLATMKNPANTLAYGSRVARFFRITKAVATPVGLNRETIGESEFEMQQIIGYGVIEPDGSMSARVPGSTPVTITALDRQGRGFTTHTNWIQAKPGETRTCNGCHSPRRGNPIPNSVAHPGQSGGESMAETRFNSTKVTPTPSVNLKRDPDYQDIWTGLYNTANGTSISAESDITISYDDLNAGGHTHSPTIPSPVRASNGATCNASSWSPVDCAIVINYETQIQPVWDNHCVSCHSGTNPDGQLSLESTRNAVLGRYNSYQELLVGDIVLDPVTHLPTITIDPDNGEIIFLRSTPIVDAGNSRSSRLIERLYEQELLATGSVCTGGGCTSHAGLLNAAEKRMLVEWVDIGAQYYNDPFDGVTVRSAATALSTTVFAASVHPILMSTCASCHQAFGGNGATGSPPNAAFTGNRFVLTGNVDGDFNITASMVTDVCTPANSYLLVRPSHILTDTPPHPGVGLAGSGAAVQPVGSANYNTMLNWITAAQAGTICP
jgi:hypothetical protein